MRGGSAQSLAVDARHAAASLLSYRVLQLDGTGVALKPPSPNVTAIWACGDGRFIHLHGSFTHTPGILAELGLDETASEDDVVRAVQSRGAFELEDALATQGLCVAV